MYLLQMYIQTYILSKQTSWRFRKKIAALESFIKINLLFTENASIWIKNTYTVSRLGLGRDVHYCLVYSFLLLFFLLILEWEKDKKKTLFYTPVSDSVTTAVSLILMMESSGRKDTLRFFLSSFSFSCFLLRLFLLSTYINYRERVRSALKQQKYLLLFSKK